MFNVDAPALKLIDIGFRIRSAAKPSRITDIVIVSSQHSNVTDIALGDNVYVCFADDFARLENLLARILPL